jgi:PGF-pre-PGF domain-containing protein
MSIEFSLDDTKKGGASMVKATTNSVMNNWHQIVGVRNKSENKLYLYLDGGLIAEDVDSSGDITSTIPLYIGIYGNLKSNNFIGAIDEIAIYNRALTAEEIQEHYNKTIICEESWSCTEWTECTIGCTQNRTCVDENQCGTELEKPNETQDCVYCVESWTCTDWSECIDETQTRTCTDQNVCGTFDFKPNESQTCEVSEEFIPDKEPIILTQVGIIAKGASFGGAAGISGEVLRGGGLETEIKSSQMLEAVSYDYSIPIYKIELKPLTELTNSKIIIEDLGTIIPNGTKPPGKIVYRFFDITTKNIPDASDIKIYFKVDKSFYVDNDISIRSTRLLRWNSVDWQELETNLIVSDLNYYYFISNTNELSYFAISTMGIGELTAETPILWIISIAAVIMVIIVVIRRSRYYKK